MKHTIDHLERMLASKTVQGSPRLKALYQERLARMKRVRSEREERGRELAKTNFNRNAEAERQEGNRER